MLKKATADTIAAKVGSGPGANTILRVFMCIMLAAQTGSSASAKALADASEGSNITGSTGIDLDAEQAALSKRIDHQLDSYIYFDDSPGQIGEGAFTSDFKRWTDADKETVSQILERVLNIAPGLLLKATCNGKIGIKRTSILFLPTNHPGQSHRLAFACNHAGDIVISDKFFTHPCPAHIAVHELTHAADYGNHIALSKEWVEFANPTISAIRLRHDRAPNDEDCLNKEIRAAGTWPSLYGCENLTEALAEYVAAYVWDRDFAVKDKFKTAIAPRLLLPSEGDQEWSRHFRKGDRAFRAKDYETAITEFNVTAQLDPGAPIPHQIECFCYSFKGKFDEALDESSKSLALFDSLGVKPTDPYRINIVKLRGTVLCHTGNFAEAKTMWDELLRVDPTNREVIKQRSMCYAKIGELEKARQDLTELARLTKLEEERQKRSALYRPADVKALRMEVNSFMQGTSPILRGWDAESFDINSE